MPTNPLHFGQREPVWAGGGAGNALPASSAAQARGLWEAIQEAYKSGQPGVYGDIDTSNGSFAVGPQLVYLELEKPYAIPWRVTLAGLRLGTNQQTFTAGRPADNQVVTGGQGVFQQARVRWGNSIEESAIIDWPWGGASFVVHGRLLVVEMHNAELIYTATNTKPKFGAFATPAMGHAGGGPVERSGPRFTTPLQTIALGQTALIAIPRRAVGYRLFSNQGPQVNTTGYNAQVQQEDNLGAVVCVDYDGTFGLGAINVPDAASRWWPLHPAAEFVRITPNTANPGNTFAALSFTLDLG